MPTYICYLKKIHCYGFFSDSINDFKNLNSQCNYFIYRIGKYTVSHFMSHNKQTNRTITNYRLPVIINHPLLLEYFILGY